MADRGPEPTASSRELVKVCGVETPSARSLRVFDAAVGVAAVATVAATGVSRRISRVVGPLGDTLLHPPLLPEQLHPARLVDMLADRGRAARTSTRTDVERLWAALIPVVVREVLDTLDLNAIIVERVDLDGVVATVDIAGVIDRVDLDSVIQRVDIDAIVERIDIDAIVQRMDMDAIVQRLDVDAIVASVDLAAVIDRLNVVDIAEEVINEIDLPEIIRDSTGSMASQVVRDARMQSIAADEAIARLVDKLFRRRSARSTDAPGEPTMTPPDGKNDGTQP